MNTYWVSWYTWKIHYPPAPFRYRVGRVGNRDRPASDGPYAGTDMTVGELSALLWQQYREERPYRDPRKPIFRERFHGEFRSRYISGGREIYALIVAADEDTVWQMIGQWFPDYEKRSIEAVPPGWKQPVSIA